MKRDTLGSLGRTQRRAKPTHSSGRFTDLDPEKLRGGYYTSAEVANWLCEWAIRRPSDRVLEPSCGDGAFLEAAASRLKMLGAKPSAITVQLTGIEIVKTEATKALDRLAARLGRAACRSVVNEDFFGWWQSQLDVFGRWADRSYDVVVGNPPFIRYQTFPEPHRTKGMEIMKLLGLHPNRLTNIWVPFVVGTVATLRSGGRLALVLPAELLQVSYASQLRSYLTDRFEQIKIIACNELFFANAEQEVVLLLADRALPAPSATNICRVSMIESRTVSDIVSRSPASVLAGAEVKSIQHDHEKWLKYFLTPAEISLMRELRANAAAATLGTHAAVDVGVVTGKNEFFVLTSAQIEAFGLDGYTVPLVSRASHLKGAKIRKREWGTLAAADDRVHLLQLNGVARQELPRCVAKYIALGEEKEFHSGFKCSIRDPWYAVPSVWIPHGFVFRQIYDFPRIVLNQAEATSTDTIHRLTCNGKPEPIIANTYTHLTAASAEIEGRSYGGGVLELEPTEAERLLMPSVLAKALPLEEADRLVRAGRLDDVLRENDRLVLMDGMGLSEIDCAMLRDIWIKMRDRRFARRRKRPPPLAILAEAAE